MSIQQSIAWYVEVWGLFYLVPSAVVLFPLWLSSKQRVTWSRWDLTLLIVPYFLWAVLMSSGIQKKDTGNLIEPILLSLIVGFCFLFRTVMASRLKRSSVLSICLGISLAAAVLFYFFVGSIPE